jgi:hypothetical protein
VLCDENVSCYVHVFCHVNSVSDVAHGYEREFHEICVIRGFYGGNYEECRLLGCGTIGFIINRRF